MDELFGSGNSPHDLFQEKKKNKKDVKKVFKTIFIVLIILVLLSGAGYGVFYYLTEVKNRDARTDIIELARTIDFNKYTDIEGLSSYFDNINNNSYEFNASLEANSHDLNNMIKDQLKNEDINIKEFKVDFNGKVDRNSNKLQTLVDLKHKDNSIVNFEIQDIGDKILLYGKDFFQEFLGFEKSKLKSFMVKEFKLDNENATTVDEFTKLSLNTNYVKEVNTILNSIIKSLPGALEILTDENFEIQRNVKVNYRNNSLNAQTFTLKLTSQQFVNFLDKLSSLSKIEANNASIELQSLVGKSDNMISSVLEYFKQIIALRGDENLHINIYKIRNNIAKIDFIKVNNDENIENKLVFEVELISDKNSNEILVSNDELKLKISITKDNTKIYTKIDIDGKIPIPDKFNFGDNPIKEIDDKEKEKQNSKLNIKGKSNTFASEAVIAEPLSETDVVDSTVDNNQQNNTNEIPLVDSPEKEVPKVDFVEDKDAVQLNESYFTKKIELKANINFDRPINNTSEMKINLVFNSNKIEIITQVNISIKDKVEFENPMKIILLTDMKPQRLKSNMKIITETIYTVIIRKLKAAKLMK